MEIEDWIPASDALIGWFESQNITPGESVPIMAIAMVCAVHSLHADRDDDDAFKKDLKQAAKLIPSMAKLMPILTELTDKRLLKSVKKRLKN